MDEIDRITDMHQQIEDMHIAAARKRAAEIPKGENGECSICQEYSERLVFGNCAACRDKYKLR